jgi:hypothetical protein
MHFGSEYGPVHGRYNVGNELDFHKKDGVVQE